MRRFLLLLFVVFLSMTAFAQLEVKKGSFKEVPGFVNVNTEKMYDDNDKPYAILKIKTENLGSKERRELSFGGDARTFFEVEYKDGEVWLYISYYASYIKISHEELSSTEFYFPFDMEPKKGYELTLVNKANAVVSGWAALTVTTKPENGAKVLLNGRDVNAVTPYSNNMIPSGKYEITVSKYKFATTTKVVDIQDGENKTVEINMPYAYGKLIVNTEPFGAAVYIDGIDYGVTPTELNNVVIGTHELKLEKSGCASVIKTILLDGANCLTINEKLSTTQEISISTDGIDDKIFVDGKYIGDSPLTATLSYGEHDVKVVRKGKEISKRVNVTQTGGESFVKINFFENKTFTVNGVTFEMIAVKGGTFMMGCTSEQDGDCDSDEKPTHCVTLSDYYIGKYEVSQELWYAVMGTTVKRQRNKTNKSWPIRGEGNNYPMYYISWNECQEFVGKLSQITGHNFRLPTEAEWEYAARGGNKSEGYKYSGNNNLNDVAWYKNRNIDLGTKPVGTKAPNELGIYDMIGNVLEWCQDWYDSYGSGIQTNPIGPASGLCRIGRGGSWLDLPKDCRVSNRYIFSPEYDNNNLGFRLVLDQANKLPTGREISISTDGIGDKIFVDGNYIGGSPLMATLSFGEHEVKAARDDEETSKRIIVEQNGGITSTKLSFENKTFTVNGVTFEMIAVKGGTFTMGGTAEQGNETEDNEQPTHKVTLSDYYLGKFEVTQELWQAVMGTKVKEQKDKANTSWQMRGEGDNYPVCYVSWNECQDFVGKLSQITGQNFRLPTEAEWEYASRGGNKSDGYKYSGSTNINNVAWYTGNSNGYTHQVGLRSPNELGIYDMTGNVWEWCQDWYGNYSSSSQTNPMGPSSGSFRVVRGGSWNYGAVSCRVSNRGSSRPDCRDSDLGFRLAADK